MGSKLRQKIAAFEANRLQEAAGEKALATLEETIGPFTEAGQGAVEQLEGEFLPAAGGQGGLGPRGFGGSGGFGDRKRGVGGGGFELPQFQPEDFSGLTSPSQFQGFNTDPSRVLNNPLFAALAKDQEQRLINQQAGLGRAGSGETNDLLTQNLLRLGTEFQDRDIRQQQQGFQNLFQTEQQRFDNQFRTGQTGFQNRFQTDQQELQNRLAANQQRFGQIFDTARLGANTSVAQGTSGANIQQGIGNTQAAGIVAGANAQGTSTLGQVGGLVKLGSGLGLF